MGIISTDSYAHFLIFTHFHIGKRRWSLKSIDIGGIVWLSIFSRCDNDQTIVQFNDFFKQQVLFQIKYYGWE